MALQTIVTTRMANDFGRQIIQYIDMPTTVAQLDVD